MNRKSLISIVCAIFFGLIGVLLVNQYIKKQKEIITKPLGNMIDVVVVKKDVPAGTIISADIIGKNSIPRMYARGKTVDPSNAGTIIGRTLRVPLESKDQILWTDLIEPKDEDDDIKGSLLARRIPKNQRALTISVDNVSSISGLLRPNDHVDLLCSLREESSGEEATLTLLQNLTVIATGKNISNSNFFGNFGTVTLLVMPEEAELITFAQKRGSLSLILRNPNDIETRKDMKAVKFSNILKPETRRKIQTKRDIEIIKPGR